MATRDGLRAVAYLPGRGVGNQGRQSIIQAAREAFARTVSNFISSAETALQKGPGYLHPQ